MADQLNYVELDFLSCTINVENDICNILISENFQINVFTRTGRCRKIERMAAPIRLCSVFGICASVKFWLLFKNCGRFRFSFELSLIDWNRVWLTKPQLVNSSYINHHEPKCFGDSQYIVLVDE